MKAHEDELRSGGIRYIAGIDEVGRGPLAGPVCAACVVLPDDFDVPGVNDSKKLTAKKREELSAVIRERAVAYGIGTADNNEIDEINILEATKAAMKRAIAACNEMLQDRCGEDAGIDMLLIDAVHLDVEIPQESIIKGDEKSLSIAAASIVAKVERDSYMDEMDEVYPGYGFSSNKGYGTAAHYEGLRNLGYTPIHRRSFLRKFEEQQEAGTESGEKKALGKKVYAVKKGRTTGIFATWDECKASVDGFAGAEYKGFASREDAEAYLGISRPETTEEAGVKAYVDGSYDAASGRYSCGVVIVETDDAGETRIKQISAAYSNEEASKLRNVAGEVMGSKQAIDYCIQNGIGSVRIYHDYEGVGKWADDKWKANTAFTSAYKAYIADARKRIDIEFVKVKAHAGNKYNEMADALAKKALEK